MPNFLFLAIPLAILAIISWAMDAIADHRERALLHAIYDGDRLQAWKSDRYNAKHSRTAVRSGRYFY